MNAYESNGQESSESGGEPTKAELRAEWEGFEFRVPAEGRVRVENVSYGDESDEHVYVVSVESGIPFDCTCPAWEYHNPKGGCKHMNAVENRPAVTHAASTTANGQRVVTDGGQEVTDCPDCHANGTVQQEPQAGADTIPTYVCEKCGYSTFTPHTDSSQ